MDNSNSQNFLSVATIASALPDLPPGEEIYDLMPGASLPMPWGQVALQSLGWVLAIWLLIMFYQWLVGPVKVQRHLKPQSPQKLAIRAIKRLRISPIWEQRQHKEICETIAAILKTYLRDAYEAGLGPPATTDEFLRALMEAGISSEMRKKSAVLLNACDQIKFAGASNDNVDEKELLASLEEMILSKRWRS